MNLQKQIPVIRLSLPTSRHLAEVIGWVAEENTRSELLKVTPLEPGRTWLELETDGASLLKIVSLSDGCPWDGCVIAKVAEANDDDNAELATFKVLHGMLQQLAGKLRYPLRIEGRTVQAVLWNRSGTPQRLFVEDPDWSTEQLGFLLGLLEFQKTALITRLRGLQGRMATSIERALS